MRFGLVHRIMTDALAALGVVALVASGQFTRGVDVAVVVGLFLAIALKEAWRHEASQRHFDAAAALLLVAVQFGRIVFAGESVLDLVIEFAVGLQIIRVATRKGAAHDQQIIVLALLHLIAGTVVGGGLGYGLCFVGLLVVTPGALVLSHLRREVEGNYRQGARDRTGLPVDVPRILRSKRVVGRQFIAVTCLLSVPILLFTIALFVVFPRVGLSLLLLNRPKGGRMIGFSDRVDLGQIGTLRSDPTIALRVTLPETTEPPPRKVLHLRGTALDAYDGRTWSRSSKQTRLVAQSGELCTLAGQVAEDAPPSMVIELEPFDPPVLFLPQRAQAVRLERVTTIGPGSGISLLLGTEGELRYQTQTDRGVRYDAFVSSEGAAVFDELLDSDRRRYLQLPDDLPVRVRELAQSWVSGVEGDYARARAIELKLRSEFRYDLSSPSGQYPQPLDHFLFESKRGHCEYYSTAMAVMLRSLSIPSRNVTGFVGGTYNKFGHFYAVRQGDAHSWVEAYVSGEGWLTFDPTPPGAAVPQSDVEGVLATIRDMFEFVSQRWNQNVVGYDLQQQMTLIESLNAREHSIGGAFARRNWRVILVVVGLLIAAGCALWLWRRRRSALRANQKREAPLSKDAVLATALYQALEQALAARGLARPASLPPLRHALGLLGSGEPLGQEIIALTERYLDARFGDRPITPDERRDYEARVKRLRAAPRMAPAQAGAS